MLRIKTLVVSAVFIILGGFSPPGAWGVEPEYEEGADRKVFWHGYGELHYNIPKTGSQLPSGSDSARMDFHRMVWGLSYHFDDRVSLHTEVDFEHAAQEMELEFAYLDFLVRPAFNVRAGAVLMPVGPLNEFHEPTLFYSVERPYVQAYIIPTTWGEGGVGAFGSLPGGFRYRLYGVSGLDAAMFTNPSQGIRPGRGKLDNANSEDLAVVGRLEYLGIPGLEAGGSFYWGGADTAKNPDLGGAAVRILEGDVRLRKAGFDLRGVLAQVVLDDAEKINAEANNSANGKEMLGWYLEGAYDLLGLLAPDLDQSLVGFVRYEDFDTQKSMPTGYTADARNDREVITGGLAYYPISNVAVKADVEVWKDGTDASASRFNLGAAYEF